MKETRKIVNQVLNKRSKPSNIDSLKWSGSDLVHKENISNTMNKFFCSIDKDLADGIASAPNPLVSGDYEANANRCKFQFRTIEVQESEMLLAKSNQELRG